jgi:hypothetical protein
MSNFSRRKLSFLIAASSSENALTNTTVVFAGVAIFLASCSAGAAPLSIKMVNHETKQTLDCSAKDPLGRTNRELLASAVESCARQLEARGFVREK